jgi:hypothetical protein
LVEPFIWNYINENKLGDDDDNNDDNEDDNNDDNDNYNDNLTMRSRGGELRSAPVVAITPLPMGCKKCKLNDIDPSVALLNDYDVERLYPYLSCALGGQEDGFDITKPSVVKSMQALLTELTIFLVLIMSLK